jgi:DNA repair protein RecO (recombination protein O)
VPNSFAYILNSKPFRENSQLLDIFTEDFGRICCVARPAKKRGKVLKGTIQPFRYLQIQWIGKGDVQTLTDADERGRHTIPPSEMMMGLYLNELLLIFSNQHTPMPDIFSAYKYTLHKLGDRDINQQIMMRFELYLLENLGHSLTVHHSGNRAETISPSAQYQFNQDNGLTLLGNHSIKPAQAIIISGELLLSLQDIQNMTELQWRELRQFLDETFKLLAPRKINTRRLLNI